MCTDLSCRLAGAEVPEGAHPSPCLGLCERAPAALRTVAGPEPREEQIPPTSPPLPQTSGLKLLRRIAEGVDPESRPEFRALERARELGPERVIELVKASPLLGRGGAAFPTGVEVGGGRAPAGEAALPRLQRRRVGAGDVQGPRADGAGPVRADRGDGDRRLRDRLRAGLHLRARRVPARARAAAERDRRLRRRRRDRAAHRRGRVRVRGGDGALPVDRGLPRRAAQQAAVPGRGRAVRQADGGEQRRDAPQRPAHPARGRSARHAALLRLGQRRAAGAVRAASSALRSPSCSSSRAPSRRRPSCSAAPPARSSGPTSSTCRSPSRAPATRARRSARAS